MVRGLRLTLAMALLALTLPAVAAATTVHVRSARVTLPAACPEATAAPGCHVTIELRTKRGHGYRSDLLVGRVTKRIRPGGRAHVTVTLTATARRLLRRYSSLALAVKRVVNVPTATTSTPAAGYAPVLTTPTTTGPPTCPAQGPAVLPTGTPGATGVVGGIYVYGGPPPDPRCAGMALPPAPPAAGTVVVLNVDGNVIATQTVADGQTFSLAVPVGTYNVRATWAHGTSNGSPYPCFAQGQITVTDGSQTPVEVVCSIP